MTRARIAFISGFDHAFSTETHVAADAARIGCEVIKVDERQLGREISFGVAGCHLLSEPADLVLYMKHHGLPPIASNIWRELEARGIKTASYHLDLYAGLDREPEIGRDPFWHTGTVFTADGGSQPLFETLGINHRWLPAAIVSDEAQRGQFDPTLMKDVVFVGKTDGYHRQWPWRQELVAALHARYGQRFRVWNHHDQPTMRGRRLNDLYASAKVVVGDSLALPGHENYWSDRYYETIGRGGCLLGPWIPGISQHFTNKLHYSAYMIGDTDALVAEVDHLLEHRSERERIVGLGRAHVAAHHTYKDRVDQLLTEVGL